MLKEIIRIALIQLEGNSSNIEFRTETITADIKNLAKRLFFEGKINDLNDFIFDLDNENNQATEKEFIENIDYSKSKELILEMKIKIQTELENTGREKNITSLLEVLDYGHLKGFLSMFKL